MASCGHSPSQSAASGAAKSGATVTDVRGRGEALSNVTNSIKQEQSSSLLVTDTCGTINPRESNLLRSKNNPQHLKSLADQHPWKLGALAEIPDNCTDAGATQTKIYWLPPPQGMDENTSTGNRIFHVDNGRGMRREKLIDCFSFGYTVQQEGRIGQFGFGFQGGCLSVGRSVLVMTLSSSSSSSSSPPEGGGGGEGHPGHPDELNMGLLSLRHMEDMGLKEIVFPVLTWRWRAAPGSGRGDPEIKVEEGEGGACSSGGGGDGGGGREGGGSWVLDRSPTGSSPEEVVESLEIMGLYTAYPSEEALLQGALTTLQQSPSSSSTLSSGTAVEIYHLDPTLVLTRDDITLTKEAWVRTPNLTSSSSAASCEVPLDRSYRAYLEVLYLKPTKMTLCGKTIVPKRISSLLTDAEDDIYAPKGTARGAGSTVVTISLGLDYRPGGAAFPNGICFYRRNRLIVPFSPLKVASRFLDGLEHGVKARLVVVVELTDTYKVGANKQLLIHSPELVKMEEALAKKCKDYIAKALDKVDLEEMVEGQQRRLAEDAGRLREEVEFRKALAKDSRTYLQCCDCGKLRFVSQEMCDRVEGAEGEEEEGGEVWTCAQNEEDPRRQSCDAPQEPPREDQGEDPTSVASRTEVLPIPGDLAARMAKLGVVIIRIEVVRRLAATRKTYDKYFYTKEGRYRSLPELERSAKESKRSAGVGGGDAGASAHEGSHHVQGPSGPTPMRRILLAPPPGGKRGREASADPEAPSAKKAPTAAAGKPNGGSGEGAAAVASGKGSAAAASAASKTKAKGGEGGGAAPSSQLQHQRLQMEARLETERKLLAAQKQALDAQRQELEKKSRAVELEKKELEARKAREARRATRPIPLEDRRICLCAALMSESREDSVGECQECRELFHPVCLHLTEEEMNDRARRTGGLRCVDHRPVTLDSRKRRLEEMRMAGLAPGQSGICATTSAGPPPRGKGREEGGREVRGADATEAGGGGGGEISSGWLREEGERMHVDTEEGQGGTAAPTAPLAPAAEPVAEAMDNVAPEAVPLPLPQRRPDNWPSDVHFIGRSIYSDLQSEGWRLQRLNDCRAPLPGVVIRTLPPDHPVMKRSQQPGKEARGLFATSPLNAGHWVGAYLGHARPPTSADGRSQYAMVIPSGFEAWERKKAGDESYPRHVVDAHHCGKETRFINDHRGFTPSRSPNVEFAECVMQGELVVGVRTLRRVEVGEELLTFYGDGFPLMEV